MEHSKLKKRGFSKQKTLRVKFRKIARISQLDNPKSNCSTIKNSSNAYYDDQTGLQNTTSVYKKVRFKNGAV